MTIEENENLENKDLLDGDDRDENVDDTDVSNDNLDDSGDDSDDGLEDDDGNDDSGDVDGDDNDDDDFDEAAYVKQFGYPDEITTIDKALEYGKAIREGVLPDLKRGQTLAERQLTELEDSLRAAGFTGGVGGLLDNVKDIAVTGSRGGMPNASAGNSPSLMDHFNQKVQTGEMDDTWRPVIAMMDVVLTQRDNELAQYLYSLDRNVKTLHGRAQSTQDVQFNLAYDSYVARHKGKGLFSKEELRTALKELPASAGADLDKAHAWIIVKDPQALQKIMKSAESAGVSRATKRFKRGRKRRSMPAKGGSERKLNPQDFVNASGQADLSKIEKLNRTQQDYILTKLGAPPIE